MNKAKFLELVKDPGLIKENDQNKLKNLASEHPYSQIIHALNVKGCKIWNHSDFEKVLNLAAVYSYDRNVLHALIEGVNKENPEDSLQIPPANFESKPETSDEVAVEEVSDFEWINEDPYEESPIQSLKTSDELNSEVTEPVDAAPSLKTKEQINQPSVEVIEKEEEKEEPTETAKAESKEASATPKNSDPKEDPVVEPITPSAVEKLEDESSPSQSEDLSPESIEEVSNTQQPATTPKQHEDSLNPEIEASGIHAELMKNLNQLKKNKQQYQGQHDKNTDVDSREQQTKIVDNFIKNSPLLSKPNLNAESEIMSQKDLSKASSKFSNELASENLAKIF